MKKQYNYSIAYHQLYDLCNNDIQVICIINSEPHFIRKCKTQKDVYFSISGLQIFINNEIAVEKNTTIKQLFIEKCKELNLKFILPEMVTTIQKTNLKSTLNVNFESVKTFCKENRVEVSLGPDNQYECYINYKKGDGAYAIDIDFFDTLFAGINRYKEKKL